MISLYLCFPWKHVISFPSDFGYGYLWLSSMSRMLADLMHKKASKSAELFYFFLDPLPLIREYARASFLLRTYHYHKKKLNLACYRWKNTWVELSCPGCGLLDWPAPRPTIFSNTGQLIKTETRRSAQLTYFRYLRSDQRFLLWATQFWGVFLTA